ncbi:MAG: anhydro-N-acetylmuramic acid kinase [Acidobacteriaceae bacterium]
MSGTSVDGIDVAVVRIEGRPPAIRFRLVHHYAVSYPAALRSAVLAATAAAKASVPDLARLNVRLSRAYADAVIAACAQADIERADLIGCHGQTIYHQGFAARYLGKRLATTWQLGDGSWIAAKTGMPVVSDFRPADMAAGGKGAPLVPFFDFLAYVHSKRQRVVLNIGGIANMTVLPPHATPEQVFAFDTGPGNMVIDACIAALTKGKRNYDAVGKLAARGHADTVIVAELMRGRYFRAKPPKSAGREEFGQEFANALLKRMTHARPEDIVATATAFTVESIAFSIEKFAPSVENPGSADVIASGGGTRNRTLMLLLAERTKRLGYRLKTTDDFGLPSQAKEAVAFAVLAYETWHRRPSNLPSATGATHPAILGKISYV